MADALSVCRTLESAAANGTIRGWPDIFIYQATTSDSGLLITNRGTASQIPHWQAEMLTAYEVAHPVL